MKWCACILMLVCGRAYADTLYVNGSDTAQYTSLENAYTGSNPEDVIVLLPGSYGTAVLNIGHAVTITSHPDSSGTVSFDTLALSCNADGITVNGLTARNGSISDVNGTTRLTVSNNVFDKASIHLYNADSVLISGNRFSPVYGSHTQALIDCRNTVPMMYNNDFHDSDSATTKYISAVWYDFNDYARFPVPKPYDLFGNSFSGFRYAVTVWFYCGPYCLDTLSFDVRGNYWGTADADSIPPFIEDSWIYGNTPVFVCEPILTAPPVRTAPLPGQRYDISNNSFTGNTYPFSINQIHVSIDDRTVGRNPALPPSPRWFRLNGEPVPASTDKDAGLYLYWDGVRLSKYFKQP